MTEPHNDIEQHSDLPIHPSEYLREVMEERGLDKFQMLFAFQKASGYNMAQALSCLSCILDGVGSIFGHEGRGLEAATGVPAHIWIAMDAEYHRAKRNQKRRLMADERDKQ